MSQKIVLKLFDSYNTLTVLTVANLIIMLRRLYINSFRIENLQLKVTDIGGEYHSTLISAGKDAVIKYWDLSQ
jgi:hypothetical protein